MGLRDIMYLLTHVHNMDPDKSGRFTYADLLVAFRVVPVVHPGGTLKPGFGLRRQGTQTKMAPLEGGLDSEILLDKWDPVSGVGGAGAGGVRARRPKWPRWRGGWIVRYC